MKKTVTVALAVIALLAAAVVARTAPKLPKAEKLTGTVVALTDDLITIERKKERVELARTGETVLGAGVKVGQKVAVTYRMTAASVEVKAGDDKKKAKP